MELFESSVVDMMERDMKDSIYDSVYYPSLGSSPLFPDLVVPVGTLDCSLDHLDPGIMVDPAEVVPRCQTEQHHAKINPCNSVSPTKSRDCLMLPDLLSEPGQMRVEVDDSSDEEEIDDEEDSRQSLVKMRESAATPTSTRYRIEPVVDTEQEVRRRPQQWTMLVNKKTGQKAVNGAIIKVRREAERSPSLTRSPAQHSVRSPSTHSVRSPIVVRSPSAHGVRSPKVADSPPHSKSFHQSSFPKPSYSYSCLIAMALKNSPSGSLPVSEIYKFMCEHFPFFKSAPSGWKNSVRHNLSLNKCFEKIEKSLHGGSRKGCLWALNPDRVVKMDEEVAKWRKKDPEAIRMAMARPDTLDLLERGEMKIKLKEVKEEEEEEEEEEEDEEQSHRLNHPMTAGHHGVHRIKRDDDDDDQARYRNGSIAHRIKREEDDDRTVYRNGSVAHRVKRDDDEDQARYRNGSISHRVRRDDDDDDQARYRNGSSVHRIKREEDDDEDVRYRTANGSSHHGHHRLVIKRERRSDDEAGNDYGMQLHQHINGSLTHRLVVKRERIEDDSDKEAPQAKLGASRLLIRREGGSKGELRLSNQCYRVRVDDPKTLRRVIQQEEEEESQEEEEEDDEEEEEQASEDSEQSQDDQSDEEGEIPPSLKPFDRQLNSRLNPSIEQTDIGVEFSEEVYEELGLLEEVLEEEQQIDAIPVKRQAIDRRGRGSIQSQSYQQAIASLL